MRTILWAILITAAMLRLIALTHAPPGLTQDEAANAWNAWCLLNTGKDQSGVSWPIFYSRCLGGNRSTLYLYALLPFQAVGGLNVWTTRLPSALGGVLTVWLLYGCGKRLFGSRVGLLAAALLALNPWHIHMSRWGHEAGLVPLLVMGPMLLWLRAGLPLTAKPNAYPRVGAAALAGLVTGMACYGYQAVRLFLPVLLLLAVAVTWRGWLAFTRTRRGPVVIAAFGMTFAATLGPLAWKHLTDPQGIGKRGETTWVWRGEKTLGGKLHRIGERYPPHFSLDFLFENGDAYVVNSMPGTGQFHLYMLPLMLVGLIEAVRRWPTSSAARVLLVGIVLYPLPDCLNSHISANALRSLPGLGGLILLGALGAAATWKLLSRFRQLRPSLVLSGFALILLVSNVRSLQAFFFRYPRRPIIYQGYHTDLVEACRWLRLKLSGANAVYVTTHAMNLPYVVTLVALQYDPVQWFDDKKTADSSGLWDEYRRYGKVRMLYKDFVETTLQAELDTFRGNGRRDRLYFVVRPGELGASGPVHVIHGPDGQQLWICEMAL